MRRWIWAFASVGVQVAGAWGAELSCEDLWIRPGAVGEVRVSGVMRGEPSFGVTLMLELVGRPGNTGTLTFTPAISEAEFEPRRTVYPSGHPEEEGGSTDSTGHPLSDIVTRMDPWPNVGSCTLYDTVHSGSLELNGLVDDNGSYVPAPVSFDGVLAGFPVLASWDATGIWEVRLRTSRGTSTWEGVSTTLRTGRITVTRSACGMAADCDDADACTSDTCGAGRCGNVRVEGKCLESDVDDRPDLHELGPSKPMADRVVQPRGGKP